MAAPPDRADLREVARALAAYPGLDAAQVTPLAGGLIHRSFCVRSRSAEYVLQQVSPIFSPRIHDNIVAVTEHLHAKGLPTLRLLPTREQRAYVDLGEAGIWRLMTRLPGVSFDVCESREQAAAAGALLASFHSALDDLTHDFQPLGISLHDSAAHFATLERALAKQRDHRLYPQVAALSEAILSAARAAEPLGSLPERVVHGDLKFSNVLFAGKVGAARHEAVGLIDLDTVSRLPLWAELGDAWRSWCNRRGEDVAEAALDLGLFRASAQAYLGSLSIALGTAERRALAFGLERISLELAARFAADALLESYFGWDPTRFRSRGEHNLTRARGQFSLHQQARATRDERMRLIAA